jgi:aerobic carbon-monoxide dehydrogenase large subunit
MTATQDRPAAPGLEVGSARHRKEDRRLITGRTRWTDNLQLTGMLHLAMVRSPVAHARISSIDVKAAREASGVLAVITGRDVADA